MTITLFRHKLSLLRKRLDNAFIPAAFSAFAMLALSSCHNGDFRVSGSIADAGSPKGKPLLLERPGIDGSWIPVDSASIGSDGSFSIYAEAPASPEIYRLRLADRFIYFPVDSTEHISVETSAPLFGSEFSVEGSDNARRLAAFEKEVQRFAPHAADADSANLFKRHIFTDYLRDDHASVVGFYILTKTIDGKPLFSPEADCQYFAAVATAFAQYRPDDPRTDILDQTAKEGRRMRNRAAGKQRVVQAGELSLLEISLPDENGRMVSLSSLAGKGTPVVLVFSNMTQEGAPAFNMELRKLHDSGRARIYQVSLDESRHAWSDAAANLPWTTVYAGDDAAAAKVTSDYNVGYLPTMFIYNRAGQLVDRADDFKTLNSRLSAL